MIRLILLLQILSFIFIIQSCEQSSSGKDASHEAKAGFHQGLDQAKKVFSMDKIMANYQKNGIEFSKEQEDKIGEIAVEQHKKMMRELKTAKNMYDDREAFKEKRNELVLANRKALRQKINQEVLSPPQIKSLKAAHKAQQ